MVIGLDGARQGTAGFFRPYTMRMSNAPVAKKWLGRFVSVAAAYLGVCAAGGVILMEKALHVPKSPVSEPRYFAALARESSRSGVEDVSISAADGAVLKGWYVKPDVWNHQTVILLHGVADNREGVTGYASIFLHAGYAVLLPDSRANGESGGNIVTYGLLESEDVHRWANWASDRAVLAFPKTPAPCIDLFGESLGAAIALQATAKTPGICAVVAEAPFFSFREIGYDRIGQATGTSVSFARDAAWPMVEFGFLAARLHYGLNFEQASPARALASSHVPALLIAGMNDKNIPPRHARQIYNLAGAPSELWEVPNAGHTEASRADPAAFRQRVLDWFATHTRPSPANTAPVSAPPPSIP
jgi:hypothetical protein